MKAEINHWNTISKKNDQFSDVLSLNDYMKKQNLICRMIHKLAFDKCGGDLEGMKVLDLGCGRGIATIVFAEKGADVIAIDVSSGMIRSTLERAKLAGYQKTVSGIVGSLSSIKQNYETFDLVFAGAVLHHLPDIQGDIRLISSIIREGGRLVAYEPFSSFFFDFARKYLPYSGKHHSENERPLTADDYKYIYDIFGKIELYNFGPFTALERILNTSSEKLWKYLMFLDRVNVLFFRDLFCWHKVCVATKLK